MFYGNIIRDNAKMKFFEKNIGNLLRGSKICSTFALAIGKETTLVADSIIHQ